MPFKPLAAALFSAVVLLAPAAHGAGLVISQVYGGGEATTGSPTYKADYVEIFNASAAPISLNGKSVQYGSASGNFGAAVTLPNVSVAAGQYFLVGLNAGALGANLPTPDATGSISASASNGKFALVTGTTALGCGGTTSCSAGQLANIIDRVSYGSAGFAEGGAATGVLSSTASAQRKLGGCTDTDNNSLDFTTGTPAARNTSTALNVCSPSGEIIPVCPATLSVPLGSTGSAALTASDTDGIVNAAVILSGGTSGISLGTLTPAVAAGGTASISLDAAASLSAGTYPVTVQFANNQGQTASCTVSIAVSAQPIVASCPASVNVAQGLSVPLALSATDADSIVNGASLLSVSPANAGITLGSITPAGANGGTANVNLTIGSSVALGTYSTTVRFANNGSQTADCTTSVTVKAASASHTPIYTIQGAGTTSSFDGSTLTTRGVVTKLNANGYFLQDAVGDGLDTTSDGIFVFTSTAPTVIVGQSIEVTGLVDEFNTGAASNSVTAANPITELKNPANVIVRGLGSITPKPITLPETFSGQLEQYEGMLVTINTPLTASQNYFLGQYGQVTLGANSRLYKPTNVYRPGTVNANTLQAQNIVRSIVLDDGNNQSNPPAVPYLAADNTLRAGDTVPSITGVIDYGLAASSDNGIADWRIHPTSPVVFTRSNPRPATPPAVGGNVKVASFNVLNYFTTFKNGGTAAGGTGGCAPSNTTSDCRGARDLNEFNRQRAKIIAAIHTMNADVIGLMEIQNNANTAAQNLVDGLNAVAGAGTYAVIGSPVGGTGTDAIRVAMIYKPGSVSLSGSAVSDTAAIHNRPPLAQTFALPNGEKFTVIVNHFKSKGSCPSNGSADADQGDGQGCWNARRVQQSTALLSFISSRQTAVGDSDVLVIGDINAYGQEDPVETLKVGGLIDQVLRFEANPYSYVFDGEAGYLDHALATASLSGKTINTRHWHINADEPKVIDYDTQYNPAGLYDASPFRSSDHDPVLVGLLLVPQAAQTITFNALLDRTLGDAPFYSLTATASSGLPVSFSSTTPSVCTVSGSTVTPLTTGTCSIAANQAGDASFLPAAQVLRSFTLKSSQTISFGALPDVTLGGGSTTLTATASSGLPVSFSSLTNTVCTVSGNTLTTIAAGACSVAADQAGNGSFGAATQVVQSFTVLPNGSGGGDDSGDVPLPAWALAILGVALLTQLRRRR